MPWRARGRGRAAERQIVNLDITLEKDGYIADSSTTYLVGEVAYPARRLVQAMAPIWLRIGGYWYPRGGMPIDVFYQTGEPPPGLWLPDQGVTPYRGRG